jgi:tetratricopeptide (TPR) repeat protein
MNDPGPFLTHSKEMRLRIVLLLLLIGGVYGHAVGFSFLTWDDNAYITGNRLLTEPTLHSLRMILTPGGDKSESIFVPVTYASFWLEAITTDLSPKVIHLSNILLHYGNSLLVWLLLAGLFKCPRLAFWGVLVFALHPLQVESVCWAMGRKSLLAGFFLFSCLILYRESLERNSSKLLTGAFIAFALSALSSPTVILLPPALMLLVLAHRQPLSHRRMAEIALFCGISILVYIANSSVAPEKFETLPLPMVQMLSGTFLVLNGWLSRLFLLDSGQLFYPIEDVLQSEMWAPLIAAPTLAILVVCSWAWYRDRRWPLFWIVLWLGLFGPSLYSLYTMGQPFVTADRYGYVAMVSVACLFSGMIAALKDRPHKVGIAFTVAFTLACLIAARKRTFAWQDSEAFWEQAALESPDNTSVLRNLAVHRISQNRLAEAETLLLRTISINPVHSVGSFHGLGWLAEHNQDLATARRWYSKALTVNPAHIDSLVALAAIDHRQGDLSAALAGYTHILAIDESAAVARFNRALILQQQGKCKEALLDFNIVLAADPNYTEARFKRASCLLDTGKISEAVNDLKTVVSESPSHLVAWYNLGMIYRSSNMVEKALEAFQNAASGDSPDPDACMQCGLLLEQMSKAQDAIRWYMRAIASSPSHPAGAHLKRLLKGNDAP